MAADQEQTKKPPPCAVAVETNLLKQQAMISRMNTENQAVSQETLLQHGPCLLPVDELRYSKALPHDQYGNVDPIAMATLQKACQTMDMTLLDQVPLGGTLKLHSPCTSMTMEYFGSTKPQFWCAPPPKVTSDVAAAEMVINYNMALCRDVPYQDFACSRDIQRAIQDLNRCGDAYEGTKPVTAQNIFRLPGVGIDIGPYVSQFALRSWQRSTVTVDQKINVPVCPGENFMATLETYSSCQNGTVLQQLAAPQTTSNNRAAHYIVTPRDGAWIVRSDYPNQWANQAALILLQLGCPWGPLNPFAPKPLDASSGLVSRSSGDDVLPTRITNEFNFLDMGLVDLMDLVSRAVRLTLNAVWYSKWRYLRLRPENTGYVVHLNKTNQRNLLKGCPRLSPVVLNSTVLDRVYAQQGNYLLSQAYPEGCPLHPSCTCGHCSFGAASLTIVKAFFAGDFLIDSLVPTPDGQRLVPDSQYPPRLRVDDELNKLISNIALWRDTAGVHVLSDSLLGIPIAEAVAISVLQEAVQRYAFAAGFKFRNLKGEQVTITNFDMNARYREITSPQGSSKKQTLSTSKKTTKRRAKKSDN